jgi:ankyrin repeat protein
MTYKKTTGFKSFFFLCILVLLGIMSIVSCKRDGVVTTREKEKLGSEAGNSLTGPAQQQAQMQDEMLGQVLREAALNGEYSSVKQLTEAGVDINHIDENGRTALMFAAFNGHTKIVAFLLDQGAFVDMHDSFNRTALLYASTGPFPETVKLLLRNEANPNVVDNDEHFTPLMHAAAEGNKEVVKLLLDYGADPSHTDNDGDNALSFAKENGHTDVIELLSIHRSR